MLLMRTKKLPIPMHSWHNVPLRDFLNQMSKKGNTIPFLRNVYAGSIHALSRFNGSWSCI